MYVKIIVIGISLWIFLKVKCTDFFQNLSHTLEYAGCVEISDIFHIVYKSPLIFCQTLNTHENMLWRGGIALGVIHVFPQNLNNLWHPPKNLCGVICEQKYVWPRPASLYDPCRAWDMTPYQPNEYPNIFVAPKSNEYLQNEYICQEIFEYLVICSNN